MLHGTILKQIFPGRPEYEDVAKGDEPETYWLLQLARPVEVSGGENDELNVAERDVRSVQLVFEVLSKKNYRDYRALVGRRVTVSGRLFHAHTVHHKTDVLIEVREIKREPNPPPAS